MFNFMLSDKLVCKDFHMGSTNLCTVCDLDSSILFYKNTEHIRRHQLTKKKFRPVCDKLITLFVLRDQLKGPVTARSFCQLASLDGSGVS